MDFCSQIWSAPTLHSCVFRVYLVVLVCLFSSEDTEASHHITISLQPSSATKGDDVQITCEHDIAKYSSIHPRIDVDGQPHGEDTLSSIKGYNLTSSPYSNGVLVLTLHNVTRSHNGTTFECYYRHRGTKIISSGTATLWVREKAELKSSSSKYEFSTDTSSRQESFSQLPATTSIPVNITFIESFSSSVVMANSSDSHPVNVGGIAYSGNEHASESGLLVGVIAGVGVLISALLLAIVIFSMCLMFRARSARRDRKERDRIIKSMREPSPPVLEVKVQAIQPYSTVTFKDIDSNKKNDETNEGKSSKTWDSV